MIEIKLAVVILCAICKLVGELWWHNAQRFIMPLILGIGISLVSHVWWLGLTVLPVIGVIVEGYGDKSWFKHIFGDASARGMWLFLICMVVGLGSVITHHLSLWFYIPWCLLGGIWGATTRVLNNKIIAPITGALIGSIIWFI